MDGLWARGKRTKHQIPNTKLQRNPKLQIPKPVAGSLPWSLGFGASLEFGALIGVGFRESGLQTVVARASRPCVGCTIRTGGTARATTLEAPRPPLLTSQCIQRRLHLLL